MKKIIIIATKNKGKVREIKHVLKPLKLKILSLLDLPQAPDIKENGKTLIENAVKKANTIVRKFDHLVLADDSGLEVNALRGKPGIKSARYAGPNPTSKKLCTKLLRAMKNRKHRKARFVCVMAMASSKRAKIIKGICRGKIGYEMKGTHGFGYDPVFIPDGYDMTFAQMPLKQKNKISHRGKALRKVADLLRKMI